MGFPHFVKFRAVLVAKGIMLDKITECENVELLVEKSGALRTHAFEEFDFCFEEGCHKDL